MFTASKSPYLVPFDGSFKQMDSITNEQHLLSKKESKKLLKKTTKSLDAEQNKLYADDTSSVLLIFQAMDAAGKDSTIRSVMRGINPAGCQVYSFKKPSKEELDHDFLWRSSCRLPERGKIGIFNRSYYEEALVVKVHPEYLSNQNLPVKLQKLAVENPTEFWRQRYESIRNHELHLANNGTLIVKFWLNVSRDEQKSRFLARLKTPSKYWKFAEGDLAERACWKEYMQAYEEALNETSRPWAPWYAIPADNKPYMQRTVADIVLQNIQQLKIGFPSVDKENKSRFKKIIKKLEMPES